MTDMNTSGSPANLGTLGVDPVLTPARIPSVLAEWAAFIPLLCHLTSSHHEHDFIGEAALRGRICISLFPRLGVLRGIAQLLYEGPEFLDRASSTGGRRCDVWDVKWGSVFPCANGAASAMVAGWVLRGMRQAIRIPEHVLPSAPQSGASSTLVGSGDTQTLSGSSRPDVMPSKPQQNDAKRLTIHENLDLFTLHSEFTGLDTTQNATDHSSNQNPSQPSQQNFRRYQTLHVMKFGRTTARISWYRLLSYAASTRWYQILSSTILGSIASVLCLYGLYGTACAVLLGAISRIACLFLHIRRPPGYLENNELHSASMLVGMHQNSSIWYLYVGDRGVIDSLLNKTMVVLSTQSLVLLYWFKVAHIAQLLAMTFVAAEKGWDGILMVLFMLVVEGSLWCSRDLQVARLWLEAEGITVKARSFEFSGRTSMVGAIQKYSGSKTSRWMDDLVCPSPRREVWLERLSAMAGSEAGGSYNQLGEFDKKWVETQVTLTMRGASLLEAEFSS